MGTYGNANWSDTDTDNLIRREYNDYLCAGRTNHDAKSLLAVTFGKTYLEICESLDRTFYA